MEKTREKFQRHIIKWQPIHNRLNAFLIIVVTNFRIKIILGDGTTNVPNKTSQASKLRHLLSLYFAQSFNQCIIDDFKHSEFYTF